MTEQMTLTDYRATQTLTRKGTLSPASSWVNRERCELCKAWQLDPIQPPDGWGVKGFCGNHQGQRVGALSWCQSYEEVQDERDC